MNRVNDNVLAQGDIKTDNIGIPFFLLPYAAKRTGSADQNLSQTKRYSGSKMLKILFQKRFRQKNKNTSMENSGLVKITNLIGNRNETVKLT